MKEQPVQGYYHCGDSAVLDARNGILSDGNGTWIPEQRLFDVYPCNKTRTQRQPGYWPFTFAGNKWVNELVVTARMDTIFEKAVCWFLHVDKTPYSCPEEN